jgi:hypothetical protein
MTDELQNSQASENLSNSPSRLRKTAALLFAELFWKQAVANREEKQQHPEAETNN